jgi:hypothetical protein
MLIAQLQSKLKRPEETLQALRKALDIYRVLDGEDSERVIELKGTIDFLSEKY